MVTVEDPAIVALHRDWLGVAATMEEAAFAVRGRVVVYCSRWCSLDSVVLVAEEAHSDRWNVYFVGYGKCQADVEVGV